MRIYPRVLIVGAREGSLGACIRDTLGRIGFEPITAGISKEEENRLDITNNMKTLRESIERLKPNHVIVTAGINREVLDPVYVYQGEPQWDEWYKDHFRVNVIGPMRLFTAWLEAREGYQATADLGHFVVIGSNSAHIARTGSAAYCASKAALAMAVRVNARELARSDLGAILYGYEPGLLDGTPMTREVDYRLNGPRIVSRDDRIPLHRMPGIEDGVSPRFLAGLICFNLTQNAPELNGCLLRVDGGEQ